MFLLWFFFSFFCFVFISLYSTRVCLSCTSPLCMKRCRCHAHIFYHLKLMPAMRYSMAFTAMSVSDYFPSAACHLCIRTQQCTVAACVAPLHNTERLPLWCPLLSHGGQDHPSASDKRSCTYFGTDCYMALTQIRPTKKPDTNQGAEVIYTHSQQSYPDVQKKWTVLISTD